MGGFKDQSLNSCCRQSIFDTILSVLIRSCDMMVKDCIASGIELPNHEEKIRNYLLENYLDNDSFNNNLGVAFPLRFMPEVPENYDSISNEYDGRIDIKVFSCNIFDNRNDYYIVECKRIDGTSVLNKKYIDEGFIALLPKNLNIHLTTRKT